MVGALQFDVIASRLQTEYAVKGSFEPVSYTTARWVHCDDEAMLKKFTEKNLYNLAEDATGALAYLAPNDWHLARIQDDYKGVTFAKTRENR